MIRRDTGRAWPSLFLLFFIAAIPAPAENKLSLSSYLDYSYSNNIFWDATGIGDALFSPGLGLELSGRALNIYMNADARIYQSNDYLNSSMFSGGFSYIKILSARDSFHVSPDLSFVQFHGDMAYLNVVMPGLALGLKHVFANRLFGRIGLNLRGSEYVNDDSYDRLRLESFLETSAFFRTQTTIRLSLGFRYLMFPHIPSPASSPSGGSVFSASAERRGHRGQLVPTAPSPRPATPSPPGASPATAPAPGAIDLAIQQPYVMLRVAQGIGFKSGLVAEFMYRRTLGSLQDIGAINTAEWALERMDEDFLWEGTRLSLGIKTEAVPRLEIAADLSIFSKRYRGITPLDLEGSPIAPAESRIDAQTQVQLTARRSFGGLGISIHGGYRKNISNDLYFRYDYFTIACGLDYIF